MGGGSGRRRIATGKLDGWSTKIAVFSTGAAGAGGGDPRPTGSLPVRGAGARPRDRTPTHSHAPARLGGAVALGGGVRDSGDPGGRGRSGAQFSAGPRVHLPT